MSMYVVKKTSRAKEEDPTEQARPSGVVTMGTTSASAEAENGTGCGVGPMATEDALHANKNHAKKDEA